MNGGKHPFYSSTYNGHDCIDMTVDDRIRRVKEFTAEQCHAALSVPDLQKSVITALNRRLMKLAKAKA